MHLCAMSNPVEKASAIIPIGWPEMTARGSEKIWEHLRKLGIIKNVNLLVGHAAMIVVQHDNLEYFDFGRYITPKNKGRARSSRTDPKLKLNTLPDWDDKGELVNFTEILKELEDNSEASHGEGSIYASIYYEADIDKVLDYAHSIQNAGLLGYNGIDRKCTNCARFVSRAMMAGLPSNSKEFMKFRFPATIIAPTPYSNVLTGASGEGYCIFFKGVATFHNRRKLHGLAQILSNLTHAFRRSKATRLPPDKKVGQLYPPKPRPSAIPDSSTYIGGIGEGAWHFLEIVDEQTVRMTRYSAAGVKEFTANYQVLKSWLKELTKGQCELVHDTHFAWLTLHSKSSGKHLRCLRLTK
jgi:hypothetical protein